MVESSILLQSYSVEVSKMPYLPCANCRQAMEINIGGTGSYNRPNTSVNPRKVIGSAVC